MRLSALHHGRSKTEWQIVPETEAEAAYLAGLTDDELILGADNGTIGYDALGPKRHFGGDVNRNWGSKDPRTFPHGAIFVRVYID